MTGGRPSGSGRSWGPHKVLLCGVPQRGARGYRLRQPRGADFFLQDSVTSVPNPTRSLAHQGGNIALTATPAGSRPSARSRASRPCGGRTGLAPGSKKGRPLRKRTPFSPFRTVIEPWSNNCGTADRSKGERPARTARSGAWRKRRRLWHSRNTRLDSQAPAPMLARGPCRPASSFPSLFTSS